MTEPFNIAELRANIGGDRPTEQLLLSMFIESTGASLELLAERFTATPDDDYDSLWKTHMHQIKGAALNLGADALCDLATTGQQEAKAPPERKKALLAATAAQFKQVEAYIHSLG